MHFRCARQRLDEAAGHDQPAEPQPGRQGLARRTGVDDVLRRQALHGADRLAVVAVLRVVVVLDDQAHRARTPTRPTLPAICADATAPVGN